MSEIKVFLQESYDKAMEKASGKLSPETSLDKPLTNCLDVIIDNAEASKGVVTVIITSLVYKSFHPEQDIRLHQSSIPGGYSGRTFDSKYITPFLKSCRFPAMAESGWLTRSLEQKVPYDKKYTGAIRPAQLKSAFLETMDAIENGCNSKLLLDYLFQKLIIQRDAKNISLAKPHNLSINEIISLLDKHFHSHYSAMGASRLPTLAIYAIYQSLFAEEQKRYKGKKLLPLESHTSADARSGRLGDIDIVNEDGTPFEAIEIKFDISISHDIVVRAKEKIQPSTVSRYYVLSTSEVREDCKTDIEKDISQIKKTHGCQLIVNGIMPTLKYYLRLLENTSSFIENYVNLLANDESVKFEHKQTWNELVSQI